MTLPTVLSTADLPLAELSAMRLDGVVYPIDACFSPVDQPDFPSVRAATIARIWPSRLIVERRSAAWVHGALREPPERHELCVDIGARARPSNVHAATVREVVFADGDVVHLGGIGVTSPVRTVTDLARLSPTFDEEDRILCARLCRIGRVDIRDCIASITARPKLSHKEKTIARLLSIADQPDETRYTS